MSDLTGRARLGVLCAAIISLLFDGVELGLMPVASLSVSSSLLGESFTPVRGGYWFAWFTAALMLGAAVGGVLLGRLGDTIGRSRALGVSVLFYSLFAGLGGVVQTQQQMLVLRFLVGLGVGGVWPNAVALAAECWPRKSRPTIAGLLGAALNGGILLLSQIVRVWTISADHWRWVFQLAAAPAVLGVLVLLALPESPAWLIARERRRSLRSAPDEPAPAGSATRNESPLQELFRQPLRRTTVIGILLGSIPLIGAWAASKWMIPWADAVGQLSHSDYKATTQGWWALGAVLGSLFGAQIATWLGRRLAYAAMSIGATALTMFMFLGTAPLERYFLPIVFAQAFIATLFFGWLPLYLPELFPTHVRATGAGIAYNAGRFGTALGVFAAGALFHALDGSYPLVGAVCSLVYLLGAVVIWWAPDTTEMSLVDE
jgi:MFS transporter, SHS family, sialic acid transporter